MNFIVWIDDTSNHHKFHWMIELGNGQVKSEPCCLNSSLRPIWACLRPAVFSTSGYLFRERRTHNAGKHRHERFSEWTRNYSSVLQRFMQIIELLYVCDSTVCRVAWLSHDTAFEGIMEITCSHPVHSQNMINSSWCMAKWSTTKAVGSIDDTTWQRRSLKPKLGNYVSKRQHSENKGAILYFWIQLCKKNHKHHFNRFEACYNHIK